MFDKKEYFIKYFLFNTYIISIIFKFTLVITSMFIELNF
jgi:hypothetical protein